MASDTPLLEFLETLGAHGGERRGRAVAAHFGDPAWEYETVRRSVGIIDRPGAGVLRVRGADRVRFLENMLTSDVKGLGPGEGGWSALLTARGKFIALFRLLAFPESLVALLDADAVETLVRGLDPYILLEEVEMEDESGRWGVVHVAGPRSTIFLSSLSGSPFSHLPPEHGRPLALPGVPGPILAVKECGTGEDGYDLVVPREHLVQAWKALLLHDSPKPLPVGADAYEVLRMEAGTPLFGVDVGPELNPIEAGLDLVVSSRKGCYPGQEVVAKTVSRGSPPKKLVGLRIEGDRPPEPGAAVTVDGEEAGRITSAVRSRNPGGVIAFAVVRAKALKEGSALLVRSGERSFAAEPVETPFR